MDGAGYNQCLCQTRGELSVKNETEQPLLSDRVVSLLLFNSITHVGYKLFTQPNKSRVATSAILLSLTNRLLPGSYLQIY